MSSSDTNGCECHVVNYLGLMWMMTLRECIDSGKGC